ncbi:T-complex-associated testis-expressed protein 1 [Rhizophlyctis rosea]|nr:T-complex-associated testis-expressed protein 1 [Rhizophlyctis rosea]
MMAQRRIIAEDPEWNLAPVPKLSELCVKVIVANFEKTPHLSSLPPKYRALILSSISTSLPLPLAAPLIPDDSYWHRRALATYKLCNVARHGNSWKRLFFEKHIQSITENYTPKKVGGADEEKKLVEIVRLAGPWVERLEIGQLRPVEGGDEEDGEGAGGEGVVGGLVGDASKVISQKEKERKREEEGSVKELKIKPTDPPPDHMDITILFGGLPGLKHFKVYYGVRDCGINFNRAYFGMTLNDCVSLCTALHHTHTLESLVIQASKIDDDRCRMICKALMENKSLKILDLSHNLLTAPSLRALSTLLATHPTLQSLTLTNNPLGPTSTPTLLRALHHTTTLQHLSLATCSLTDSGGADIFKGLEKNNSVREVDLRGNGLGVKSAGALEKCLRVNRELRSVNVSCNRLCGKEGGSGGGGAGGGGGSAGDGAKGEDVVGKMLFEAVSQNKVN